MQRRIIVLGRGKWCRWHIDTQEFIDGSSPMIECAADVHKEPFPGNYRLVKACLWNHDEIIKEKPGKLVGKKFGVCKNYKPIPQ